MPLIHNAPDSRRPSSQNVVANLAIAFSVAILFLMPAAADAQHLPPPTKAEPLTASTAADATEGDVRRGETHPPLMVIDVSERWIAELASRLFDERSRVDLTVLGVRMRGTAQTEGGYTIRCVDGDGGLCFAIDAEGTSVSTTRGREGPALIRAVTTTDFTARTLVELNGQSLVGRGTSVDATMRRCDTRVDNRSCLGRRLVRRIAKRRIRAGWAEIDRKCESQTEQRVAAALDHSVNQFRRDADQSLQRMQARFPWIGWGDDLAPVHLQTGDRVLRLTWRDGGGKMVHPFYLAVGKPSPGLKIWIDRRALRVESRRLHKRLRRAWRGLALIAPLLPDESSDAPWSVELAASSWALEVMVPSAGVIVRVPGPRDPMTAILTAAAHSIARGGAFGRPPAPDGQDDATTTPKRRESAP